MVMRMSLFTEMSDPDFYDKVRIRLGRPCRYRNEKGELPISREIVGGDGNSKKWLVEYKFRESGGCSTHQVWEDML